MVTSCSKNANWRLQVAETLRPYFYRLSEILLLGYSKLPNCLCKTLSSSSAAPQLLKERRSFPSLDPSNQTSESSKLQSVFLGGRSEPKQQSLPHNQTVSETRAAEGKFRSSIDYSLWKSACCHLLLILNLANAQLSSAPANMLSQS